MEDQKTMTIRDFGKLWGIGDAAMRRIIDDNPDFPVIVLNPKSTAKRKRKLVITDDANLWVKRNLRQ